jgi:NodT family efflux transporter outer membrane factor (OMF) lipoprotein
MRSRIAVTVSALLLLAGCGPGRTYQRPEIGVAERFAGLPAGPVAVRWWRTIGDAELDALVQRAVAANKDMRRAVLRIAEARAQLGVAASKLGPDVAAAGSAVRSRASEHGQRDRRHTAPGNLYQAGFDTAWEIDLFGTTLRAVEAADVDIQIAESDRDGIVVALTAQVVQAWLDQRYAAYRLSLAVAAAELAEEAARIVAIRAEAGAAGATEVAAARAESEQARGAVPAFTVAREAARNRLAALCGEAPGALTLADAPPPAWTGELPAGVPADLLRRRCDLRGAERRLAAAVARVGVAESDLYPRLSLSGVFALQSVSITDLASADNLLWSLGPTLRWPILASGRINALVRTAETRVDQAVVAYEGAVVEALREVADATVQLGADRTRREALAAAAAAAAEGHRLAVVRREVGAGDPLAVLAAERARLAAQDRLAEAERALAADAVVLAKALGGGWEDPALQDARSHPQPGGVRTDRRP